MFQKDSTAIRQEGTPAVPVDSFTSTTVPDSAVFSPLQIARQMEGCTPQQLDSAIQANLPQRERFLSNRPDTLCIPGLPGRRLYEDEGRILNFNEGFFNGNPILHPELPFRSMWCDTVPIPYRLSQDDIVTGGLLLGFFILICIVNQARRQLVQQTKDFFFAPKERSGPFDKETSIEIYSRFSAVFLLCLTGGLMAFTYVRSHFDLFLDLQSIALMLGIYIGCFVLYFIVKRVLNRFINWIFFPKSQQKLWTDSCSYLISVESILFFPLVLTFVYLDFSFEQGMWMFLVVLFAAKLLLAFKALKIFFPKSYGLFHLFAYLCALELMPILALWKSLAFITNSLMVKY